MVKLISKVELKINTKSCANCCNGKKFYFMDTINNDMHMFEMPYGYFYCEQKKVMVTSSDVCEKLFQYRFDDDEYNLVQDINL